MKTCRIYSLIVPVAEDFRDDRSTPPLAVIPVQLKDGRTWEAAVLGSHNSITAFRVSIPDNPEGSIDPGDSRRWVRLRSYALDCIRLTYDPNAEYFRRGDEILSIWNFLDPDKGPDLSVRITTPLNPDYRVNFEGLKHLIAATPALRPIVHLMSDGADTRLPIQFRFLSYYKIIEMHYKISTNKRFIEFAKPFMIEFQSLYPRLSDVHHLCRQLSTLRNRCAHIKLTTGELGFSHLEAETDDLFKALPVVRKMAVLCISVFHQDSPLRFFASPEEAAAQFAEMEAAGKGLVRVI